MTIPAAERLARQLHANQLDKAGEPYIGHLERTVWYLLEMFPDATEAEIEAAWLHDALEDTDATAEILIAAGVSAQGVVLVQWLTRPSARSRSAYTYLFWIKLLCREAPIGVLRVKLADNWDNSNPERVAAIPGGARMLRTRYAPARAVLVEWLGKRVEKSRP